MTIKERPILFSAPMVRALLDGSKTQTRRVFKAKNGGVWPHKNDIPGMRQIMRNCPYGQPGDRLWVREAWRARGEFDEVKPSDLKAPANGLLGTPIICEASRHESVRFGKLRPGMFIPRWASRILLEITGVRVERLQDISIRDCIAEGIPRGGPENPDGIEYREYRTLWESINGPDSWAANPWVWVIEFKKASQ